jgi:hypothetical protein
MRYTIEVDDTQVKILNNLIDLYMRQVGLQGLNEVVSVFNAVAAAKPVEEPKKDEA